MKILSIGDEVREGTYRLHSCFQRAVNFTDGRRLVTLVTPDIGAGPVNIVVGDLTPFELLPTPTPTPKSSPKLSRGRNPSSSPDSVSGSGFGFGSDPGPNPHPSPCLSQTPGQVRSRPRPRRAHLLGSDVDLRVERYSVVFANRRFLLNETQSYGSLLHIEKETSRTVFRKNLKTVERILVEESHPKSLTFLLDGKRVRNFSTAFDRSFVAQIKDGASRIF